ncbi:MAG TPA: 1,4-dihydroxy-6-naphthoate synthase [Candidatus Baltobacteraceae bacterium]|jgi:1,4-dihydroxy-6-naphthoate synthase
MDKPLTLAYSPCPNDTYIFAALTNGLIDDVPNVRVALEDVENLNNSALKGDYELTKVSYGAIPSLMDKYRILRAGGALGRGCGPLVVAREGAGKTLEDFDDKLIAIPGERTTAFMLLRLAMGKSPHIIQMRFDKIVEAIAQGTVDAGLIIHESRFTYQEAGLVQITDLGDWWESVSGMPIPLGAILVRNDLDDDRAHAMDDAIRRSLRFARANENKIIGYVREHAVEMDDDVMRRHIDLYVNEFTEDVGDGGIAAVRELFKRAHAAGILPDPMEPQFV